MAGICSNMFWTLRCLHQPCIRSRTSTTTSSDGKVRRPVLNLLKAGNRALESVGFMMQHAPRRPLPTGHHSNDLVPLRHCPPALFPTTTLHYVTSLDHCHLICRAITAGGCVERTLRKLLSLSSCSARLPLLLSPTAFSATCWRQHY